MFQGYFIRWLICWAHMYAVYMRLIYLRKLFTSDSVVNFEFPPTRAQLVMGNFLIPETFI